MYPLSLLSTMLINLFWLCCVSLVTANYNYEDDIRDNITESSDKTFSYDDILNEMNKVTEEFLEEIIGMRNLVPDMSLLEVGTDDYVDPARRRRKRSTGTHYIPDFIQDGIKLISDMMMLEKRICHNKGFVIDMASLKFNYNKYVVCLVRNNLTHTKVYYGPMDYIENSFVVGLSNPEKIFAFVSQRSGSEELVIVIINNNPLNEAAVKWYQIDVKNQISYQNTLKDLVRVSTKTAAIWRRKNILVLYDVYEEILKLYHFVGTYFDLDQFIPISSDLSALCAFTFNGVPYLVLSYNSHNEKTQKDTTIMRYNEYDAHRMHKIQSIQSDQGIIDIKYFTLGYGTNQENFLAIVEKNNVLFYKFLKSKREFIVFQRIESKGVRKIFTYADSQRLFVMGLIMQSNDVYFITYNSLRFIYSNINLRIFALPNQPVYFDRLFLSDSSRVQMLIGGSDGIRIYNVTFYHDNNLLKLWTEHLEWCKARRIELAQLEQQTSIVNERFSEAYYTSDPIVIKGTLSVPSYRGVVEAKDYHQLAGPDAMYLNAQYFHELVNMEKVLSQIETDIHFGNQELNDALFVNFNSLQTIYGNYSMNSVRIIEYNGNANPSNPNVPFTETLNIITNYLNDQQIQYLFLETVSIQNNQIKVLNSMNFEMIDLAYLNQPIQVDGLVNKVFNMSDIVTLNSNQFIAGKKRFHICLVVDQSIYSGNVNSMLFDSQSVLLTSGQQVVRNPTRVHDASLRANIFNAKSVNGIDIGRLFADAIRKNDPVPITMPVLFANGLEVYDIFIDGNGKLNGENMQTLSDDVLWLNAKNQTIFADYYFESDVSVMGNLFVNRINNKNIPADLVVGSNADFIEGKKSFEDSIYIQNLNVSHNINDILVINGIPDIILRHLPQNITGRKTFTSLHLQKNSSIGGLLNRLNIQDLYLQSQQKPTLQHFDKLYIENFANFEGGLWFDHLNTVSRKQFDNLLHNSLSLNQQWDNLEFNHVHFDDLRVNILDCDKINGLRLENDLLTVNTNQTVMSTYAFDNIVLQNDSFIYSINNYTMSNLNSIVDVRQNQTLTGTKIFQGDVYVNSLQAHYINEIPMNDVVFLNEIDNKKNITGVKHFQTTSLQFDNLLVDHLNVKSINNVDVAYILTSSLMRTSYQNVPNHVRFNALWSQQNEDFRNLVVNGVDLRLMHNDIVYANSESNFHNVSARKTFIGDVKFQQLEFNRLFDGVTLWEFNHNWMIQNVTQNVFANFSIDHLSATSVYTHDSKVNNVDLNWLHENAIWLDRKKTIWANLQFMGNTEIHGYIQSSFNINKINIQNDLLYSKPTNVMQKIYGQIKLLGNLTVTDRLDINGFLNGIQINQMCSRVYRPSFNKPVVIKGDVQILSPARFEQINGIPYTELQMNSLRHNLPNQRVYGKKIIEKLYLNGPTQLNKYINNLNLNYIFLNYMSLTRNQDVEANIIFHSNQLMAGDVFVKDNFYIENGVVGGFDIIKFDKRVLRVYGDQQYEGNINFVADVDIDLDLNLQWINGINSNYLMHKKRKTNIFQEEVVFTQNLNVRNGAHIVSGRRISGLDINGLTNYTVQRNSGRNYTIYGTKTFDAVHVYYIHTKPLNRVPFSRENLMLKNYDQVVRGEKYFNGDIVINSSVVANTINQVPINDLNNRMVKRTQNNIVKAKVRVHDLNVNSVKVNALIDNIDISLLNTITKRVSVMKNLEREVKNAKDQFDLFEKNLNIIMPKLFFYDNYATAYGKNFKLDTLYKPLLVCTHHKFLYIFMPAHEFHRNQCNQIKVYAMLQQNNTIIWDHKFTLNVAGRVISIEQNDNRFLISSNFHDIDHESFKQCILKNNQVKLVFKSAKSGILFQMFNLYERTGHGSMIQTGLDVFEQEVYRPNVNWIWSRPNLVSVAFSRLFYIVYLNSSDEIYQSLNPNNKVLFTLSLEGSVKKVYHRKTSIFMLIQLEGTNMFQLDIYRFTVKNLTKVQSIPVSEMNDLLIIDNGLYQSSIYPQWVLINENPSISNEQSSVYVYVTLDGNHYFKVQEIPESNVKKMHVVYSKSDGTDPFVLIHTDRSISIYRFSGMQGFEYYGNIHATNRLQSIHLSSTSANHYIIMFYSNCDDNEQQYIKFLYPVYRQELIHGHTVSIRESNELHVNKTKSTVN